MMKEKTSPIGTSIEHRNNYASTCFNNIKVFTFFMAIASLTTNTIGFFLISQVTALEKQIGLSSTQSGFLLSANDIGYIVVILLASHLARDSNKPRILGLMSVGFGTCACIAASTHFIMWNYIPDIFYVSTGSENNMDATSYLICQSDINGTSAASAIEESRQLGKEYIRYVRSVCYIVIIISLVFQGAIKAPRVPLVTTYIDDHVDHSHVGTYLGIINGSQVVGVAIAFALGAVFSNIYVTLQKTGLTNRDPRWIGAWWLGLFIIGACVVVAGIPLMFFPKRLKVSGKASSKQLVNSSITDRDKKEVTDDAEFDRTSLDENKDDFSESDRVNNILSNTEHGKRFSLRSVSKKNSVVSNSSNIDNKNRKQSLASTLSNTYAPSRSGGKFKKDLKDFPKALGRLLGNTLYVLLLTSDGVNALVFTGRLSYLPKYLENQFLIPSSTANTYMGMVLVIGATLGSFSSGLVVTLCRMTVRTCMIFIITVATVAHVISMASAAFACPAVEIQNFDLSNRTMISSTQKDLVHCSERSCWCANSDFFPVCGDDGLTYFSPCHAGCTQRNTTFSNCSCIEGSITNRTSANDVTYQTATAGYCPSNCNLLIPYVVCGFFNAFIGTLAIIPMMIAYLRVVEDQDRSLAVGLVTFTLTLFGTFLSPILFGALIDTACIIWKDSCNLYDMDDFRIKYHVTVGWLGIVAQFFNLAALLLIVFNRKYRRFCENWYIKEGGETEANTNQISSRQENNKSSAYDNSAFQES